MAPTLAIVAAALASPALGDVKNWNAGNGDWSAAGNWSPLGAPGPADVVFIGNTAPAHNDFVTLDVSTVISTLVMTDGMRLDTDGKQLVVSGETLLSGENLEGDVIYSSGIVVDQGPLAVDFNTGDLTLADGARVRLDDGAAMVVNGLLDIGAGCSVWRDGTIWLYGDGPVAMRRNGALQAGTDGMTIWQLGDGLIDLDGDSAGDSTLNITTAMIDGTAFANLTIHGDALVDTFDDDLWISANNFLTMDLEDGWSMGPNAELRFSASTTHPGPAQINGSAFTMHGTMDFAGTGAHGQINAAVTFSPSVHAELDPEDRLECNASTTINGGTFTLGEGAAIDFDGPTIVHGGFFSTFGSSISEGTVDFNGTTTWDGDIVVAGIAHQQADASVSGQSVIDAVVFDMDGAGAVSWSIGSSLTINAAHLDTNGGSTFDGSISSAGTFLGKLTVNLDDPDGQWTMAGTASLGGVGTLLATRVEGSRMRVTGDLDITGKVQVTADTVLASGAAVTITAPTAELRLAGTSTVSAGATFFGVGTLRNATSGELTLDDGVDLGGVGLVNTGVLRVADGIGAAEVDRFENTAGATWVVELGGTIPALEYDQLNVMQDDAVVGGALKVAIVDGGKGLFEPELGDLFAILQAPGSVAGTFANDPVSFVPGKAYVWSIFYAPSEVVLELDAIVPCDADLSGDGIVDGADLGILLSAWGACDDCLADINGDGLVDGGDLGTLLAAWGPCPF